MVIGSGCILVRGFGGVGVLDLCGLQLVPKPFFWYN